MLDFISELESEPVMEIVCDGRERSESFVNILNKQESESTFTAINLDVNGSDSIILFDGLSESVEMDLPMEDFLWDFVES